MDFPSDIPNPEYPLGYKPEDNSIISNFEDGSRQSRRKFTKSRSTWTLKWKKLKQKYFTILDDFIKNDAVFATNKFNWTNPSDKKTYEVRCVKYEGGELVEVDCWNVSIELQEV